MSYRREESPGLMLLWGPLQREASSALLWHSEDEWTRHKILCHNLRLIDHLSPVSLYSLSPWSLNSRANQQILKLFHCCLHWATGLLMYQKRKLSQSEHSAKLYTGDNGVYCWQRTYTNLAIYENFAKMLCYPFYWSATGGSSWSEA